MKTVFLSYARADGTKAAARLRSELERAGFTVWRDIEDMHGGKEWKDQLRQALRQVDAVLVLLTPGSVASQTVTWEWENALTLEKQVIPLLIGACDVPDELSRRHYHDFSRPKSYTIAFAALIRDLAGSAGADSASPADQEQVGSKYVVHNPHKSATGDNARVNNYGPDEDT